MKNFFLLVLSIILLVSCSPTPQQYQPRNHSGMREWKGGKQMPRNRRAYERPQCVDSW